MSEIECEKVQMAIMARLDSEPAGVSAELIGLHLDACAECRKQAEEIKATDEMLKRQQRLDHDADLWPAVSSHVAVQRQPRMSWQPFVVVGVLLVAYKLFEMLSEQAPGFVLKLLPLAIAIALFAALKENPFKVNPELMLEK
jgi:predicted anti-sigma-YlaC factor YlaD